MRLASDFRRAARDALAGRWGLALAVSLVAALLGGGIRGGIQFNFNTNDLSSIYDAGGINLAAVLGLLRLPVESLNAALTPFSNIIMLYGIAVFLVGGAAELGHSLFYVRLMRGERPEFETLFSRFSIFGKALGLRLFMALFILLWSLLLVIPGIVAGYSYRMAPYLMAEHPEMGIREAVDESKRLTAGYKGRWFCLDLSFIGWGILCLFTLGIGFLWLNPYMSAASAEFYRGILADNAGSAGGMGGADYERDAQSGFGGPERI
ncbi:MAG: hypothetical protein BWY35_01342 [Firmicutes bacterium ADurb.Bin248]|nr:MAG: hypothetical protein BWY35_01342 [Firmicutes bacterium ADurb.Bin248]HOG01148.1 DUF975 family protein [Clostridia bacterium]